MKARAARIVKRSRYPNSEVWVGRWRPPAMSERVRGRPPGLPPNDRWESVLQEEQSLAYRLVLAVSGVPILRRLLGVPDTLTRAQGVTIEDRERRVRYVAATRLARLIGRIPRRRGHELPRSTSALQGMPPIGPALDREIDRSLEVARSVPFEELQRRGWHLQPENWACPLNDVAFLRENPDLWLVNRLPEGIELDLDEQEELVLRLASYSDELSDIPSGTVIRNGRFVWQNGTFIEADAYAYYGLVRDLRPRNVIEVGSGVSTLLLARAVANNGGDCNVTLVEPYPNWHVLGELPDGWRVLEKPVQHVELELFETLEAGDVLFYDGTHCAQAAGDVNWMFFEVLPRLAPGVWFHVHDIFWPWDYPPSWLLDEGLTWNEQYLLQAFLMHNDRYRVRLANQLLFTERRERIEPLLPAGASGASVWIEKLP